MKIICFLSLHVTLLHTFHLFVTCLIFSVVLLLDYCIRPVKDSTETIPKNFLREIFGVLNPSHSKRREINLLD